MNRYVPPRFIPDEEVVLGEPETVTCSARGCDEETNPSILGPSWCSEHFYTEFFHGKAGECQECGGQLVFRDNDTREVGCLGCMRGFSANSDVGPHDSNREYGV